MPWVSAAMKRRPSEVVSHIEELHPDAASGFRESGEKLFTSAFENAPIGMALLAPDSRRLRVNRAFCRMLGYTEREMLARTVHDITHPDDVAADLRERGLCLAGSQDSYERQKRYVHRDGRIVWGHLTCTLVRDGEGQPLHFISQVQDITERKQSEAALRQSEARFRSLTMLSSDWYWEQDERFRFTLFSGNQNAGQWGSGKYSAVGRCRWEVQGYMPLGMSWDQHRAVLESHLPFHDFELILQRDGESTRYISCSGEPVFDAGGRFTGYRGTARDITARKLAEQRLHDTQAMMHMAAQIGRLGAWEYEVGKPHVNWSQEVCAIHEVKQGFCPTFEQSVAFFAPQYRSTMRSIFKACLKDGSPFDVEAQLITAKGRCIWVRVIGEAEWDAKGRVRRIQGAGQDISEAKQAAEQSRQVAEQLTTTLESITDAFFTIDRKWRFTYVNAEAERTLKRSREELIGVQMWKAFPALHGSEFFKQYRRAMEENVAVQFEAFYPPSNVWAQIKAYPSEQGLAVYAKDVTERNAAQREILRLNAELEERVKERTVQLEAANKELEAFSYSIAHDLRAPLGSIDGFSMMLEQAAGDALAERERHYLSRIRGGVRQMGELTDGLLALANLSRASVRDEEVDLAALARAAVGSCRERAPDRNVEVRIAATLPARGDPRLLSQVIGNLVGNAWKFTARRECALIEVGSCAHDTGMMYFVRDNGAGFDMAYASRMFEAFQRMHSSADFDGTGIGLAIVHKVIARHSGRIWAEAAPEQGATFFFTLGRT